MLFGWIRKLISEKLIGCWTLTLNKHTKSNDTAESGSTFLVGNRMQFVPRNVSSFWSTYELQHGQFDGLKFGGGVTPRTLMGSINVQY